MEVYNKEKEIIQNKNWTGYVSYEIKYDLMRYFS